MPRVSSTDLSNRLDQYQDEALKRPIIITKNNRERLVMLSIEEYRRLKQLDRKAKPHGPAVRKAVSGSTRARKS